MYTPLQVVLGTREWSIGATASVFLQRVGCLCLAMLAVAVGAQAQRFLELGATLDDPLAVEQREEGLETFAVEIDIDMLRTAPQQLALPTPDGRVLVAELSVFEHRGNGDFMWAGGFAEAGFESVALTVRGGHLSGLVGEPGGAWFRISSDSTGQGRLVDTSRALPKADRAFCPGGLVPEGGGLGPAMEAASAVRPQRVVKTSNGNTLDVLVLYTPSAGAQWTAQRRTPQSASQSAVDYMNMVFRNGQLDGSARLVHVERAPYSVTEVEGDGTCVALLGRLTESPRVARLRAEYRADTVHLFAVAADASANDCAGVAGQFTQGQDPSFFSPVGLTLVDLLVPEQTFVHETGHNLGLNHDPAAEYTRQSDGTLISFEEHRHTQSILPYAFGHAFESGNVKSIMASGGARTTPWFSTVREEPMAWKLGVRGERENERALREVGLALGAGFGDHLGLDPEPPEPPPGWRPATPSELKAMRIGATGVRLTWVDNALHEDGFRIERRQHGRRRWQSARMLPQNTEAVEIDGLVAGGRYDFRVLAHNENGVSDPGNVVTVSLEAVEYTSCVPTGPQIAFDHGYTVSMCVEYLEGGVGPPVMADAKNYGLESRESGILYFFGRDNAEVLVKVLDACAIDGHRWVFVAPVTDLAFNLHIDERASGKRWTHRNPKGGQTASTKSDVRAFSCSPTASAGSHVGAADGIGGVDLVQTGLVAAPERWTTIPSEAPPSAASAQPLRTGQGTACEPDLGLMLAGGFSVSLCYETREGKVDDALNWKLDSRQSGLLYFFDRNNAEVLIKVLDGCAINGHRWVFVAPVTDLAFNLHIESPAGELWTHHGFQGLTASARSDIQAFACN